MRTLLTKARPLALLLAAAFILTACGGAGGGQQGSGSGSDGEQGTADKTGGSMAGMDHGQMGHGSMSMGSGSMARQMVMENGKYSDERFMDAMVSHHQGAIAMARVALGKAQRNRKLMDESGVDISALEERAATLAGKGRTPMFVAVDGESAGLVAVADTIKPNARETLSRFKAMGVEAVMITGDNKRTAEAVARELGIERVFSEVLPADKARYVEQLQREGKQVAMVGDGVNDAPALAQADIGIAIGAGTDGAIETAKVVLMKSDPLDVTRAVVLSKATVRKMKQNLVWASVYNVLAIPIAAGVLYPVYGIMLRPEWSALLMSVSSIIVAVNAVLLKGVEDDLDEPGPDALRSEPTPGA